MEIISNSQAVDTFKTVNILITGGVEPYTVSLAGVGSITVTGADTVSFDSGDTYGSAAITVIDDNGEEAVLDIGVMPPIALVANLIEKGLGITGKQISLYNQRNKIPNDDKLYVSVGILTTRMFSNQSDHQEASGVYKNIQSANLSDVLNIRLRSYNSSILSSRIEIAMAFMSDYAKRQMALNSFYIGKLPETFSNVDEQEGPKMIYGFNFNVSLQYKHRKVTNTDYYDSFSDPEIITNS
tara:strand:- start:26404 stop:27123 length:720 start_codon:yes stop_codon:yes gene_type:complete